MSSFQVRGNMIRSTSASRTVAKCKHIMALGSQSIFGGVHNCMRFISWLRLLSIQVLIQVSSGVKHFCTVEC